jgi:hypothetical protein
MGTRSLAPVALTLVSTIAHAGVNPRVLYSQTPSSGTAHVSSTGVGGVPFDDVRTADSFANDGDWAIFSVVWWGGDQTNAPPTPLSNIESFEITFYNPTSFNNPTPGTVIHTETVTLGATGAAATGNTVGEQGAPEFRFEHAFDAPIFVLFNQVPPVWISIAANYVNPPGAADESFLWSGSWEGDDLLAQDSFDGAGYQLVNPQRPNAAFEIRGVLIPSPGAASLLALAGLAGSRRRR